MWRVWCVGCVCTCGVVCVVCGLCVVWVVCVHVVLCVVLVVVCVCVLFCCGGACVWCVVKLGTLSLLFSLLPLLFPFLFLSYLYFSLFFFFFFFFFSCLTSSKKKDLFITGIFPATELFFITVLKNSKKTPPGKITVITVLN